MSWRLLLRKEAVTVTTASRPNLFRVAYSKKRKDDEDGKEEERDS